jgi:hypothetical protein
VHPRGAGRLRRGAAAAVSGGRELADGKLVIPWQHAMPSTDAYYLAYPEHSAEVPKVRFCEVDAGAD